MGVGMGMGMWGVVPCMHACTHTHMHVKHAKHDKHGCLHVSGHLQFLYMYTCVCVHVCVCACVCVCMHVCGGHTPHALRHTPPTCPLPRAKETQIRRITITLERIEIIQFCLKICDPWTLLHTYRLGLMCRWGCPIPNGTFMFLTQKGAPVTLQ